MKVKFHNSIEGGAFWQALLGQIRSEGLMTEHNYALSETAYRERRGGAHRLATIWKMYPGYCLTSCFRPGKADLFVACTNPFCLPALLRLRLGKKRPTVFLVYDLFPDALELSNTIASNRFASRCLALSTKYALKHCSATVFLGDYLKAHAEQRYGNAANSCVIPVGADGRPFANSPPLPRDTGLVTLLYSGNLGKAHDTSTLAEYFRKTEEVACDLQFHSFGGGYAKFQQEFPSEKLPKNCQFAGPLPGDQWQARMLESDVALVTISPGWENVVMPSKTYSALVAGQAILGICAEQSDLAQLIRRHDCGWVVTPGNAPALRHVIENIFRDRDQVLQKRRNAFEAGHKYYECSVVAKQWVSLFERLGCRDRSQNAR